MRVQRRRRKVDETPAVPDGARSVDPQQLRAHQRDDVPRDLRIAIVKPVRPEVVEVLPAGESPAQPAGLVRRVDLPRRQVAVEQAPIEQGADTR